MQASIKPAIKSVAKPVVKPPAQPTTRVSAAPDLKHPGKTAVESNAVLESAAAVKAASTVDTKGGADAGDKTRATPAPKPGSMPTCKILVVDDSPTERFFLTDLLVKRGYTVLTAENGDEAIAIARAEQPALVVMDVVMPGISGYQATRVINKDPMTQNIPVILCTSKSAESDRVWGLRQGARDYVVKPIDIPDLLTKIAKLA